MHELAQILAIAGLSLGVIEYRLTIRRRADRRRDEAMQKAAEVSGLQGLVRVFLAER